jgi:hypothetical protein
MDQITPTQLHREYGEITLRTSNLAQFRAPFLHLNFLGNVLTEDNDAIMRVRGEPEIMDDHFHVMSVIWSNIESACRVHQYDIFHALMLGGERLLADIARLRHDLAKLEAADMYLHHSAANYQAGRRRYAALIPKLMETDFEYIIAKDQEYGASWLKRGGVGAFMMLARKWDRFAPMVQKFNRDPIAMLHAKRDRIDDVQDLRRYLALVAAEWCHRQTSATEGGSAEHPANVLGDQW